ncbi:MULTISPECIES: DUF1353 domain-containing protein [unclassified Pseudomonas]|jgi:hypothetical protein|uniref:DUF1353 domain-containing protein n=1 Tax=unclassified Pseudomonas TaxID=196821 RepID=UPI003862134A
MAFHSDLVLRQSPTSRRWELAESLRYLTRDNRWAVVPAGYPASIVGPAPIVRAVILHRYLYAHLAQVFSKTEADRIFYRALQEGEVARPVARAMWFGARVIGRFTWKRAGWAKRA